MIKDIDISHYYKKFIETSNDDMAKYNKELEVINKMKADCRAYIKSKNQVIKDDLKINLNEYGFQFLNPNLRLKISSTVLHSELSCLASLPLSSLLI
jgi:hypothetical protein